MNQCNFLKAFEIKENRAAISPSKSYNSATFFYIWLKKKLYWKILAENLGKATAAARAACYPVLQVHAGSFPVSKIHWTLTVTMIWTTRSLTCVRDHWSYVCIHGASAHRQRVSTTFLTQKNSHKFVLWSWWGSNLGSLRLESDALPTEPPITPL